MIIPALLRVWFLITAHYFNAISCKEGYNSATEEANYDTETSDMVRILTKYVLDTNPPA